MADFNRVIVIGNLTRDPDYKQLTSGQAVCRLGIASNRQFKNRQTGANVQEVCFIDVDVWGPQAESCRQYLQKGRPVLIEGRLKYDTWQDAAGQNRSKHSIVADRVVFLGSAAASVEVGEDAVVGATVAPAEPATQLEKDLLDQIDQIKTRTEAKKKANKTESSESAAAPAGSFKDEPPFADDLPF